MLKKILIILICLVTAGIIFLLSIIVMGCIGERNLYPARRVNITGINTDYEIDSFNEEYEVYEDENLIASFDNYEDACNLCDEKENSVVRKKGSSANIYENIYRYTVIKNEIESKYRDISEAFQEAYENGGYVYDNVKGKRIYEKTTLPESHKIMGVPRISQYPELYRGCEITSLCMLFNYWGVMKTKMELAQEIFKDKTPFSEEHGVKHYGNPNIGFVGDIYSKENKGYGVYHKPIYNLLEMYFHERAADITGTQPEHIYYFINKDCPVWVVVNSKFKPLSSEYFEKWYTSEGEIEITYSEHAVLITGYDGNYVYFNDPMHSEGEKTAERSDFEAAWNQMGSQAVVVLD